MMTTQFRQRVKSFGRSMFPPPLEAPTPVGVFVVDDEASILRYADRVLRQAGYEPLLASSGADAIRQASTMTRLDLLVTDLMMPDMKGDELTRRLRQSDPDVKVLYLTGFSDRLFEEKPILWQSEAFLAKPYSAKALEEAVSLLLHGHIGGPPPVGWHGMRLSRLETCDAGQLHLSNAS